MVNRKEFIGELAMLAQLSHPNVVQFLGAVTKTQPLVMVTEYLPKVKILSLTFLLTSYVTYDGQRNSYLPC
jgi:serine/threonine protein kinase